MDTVTNEQHSDEDKRVSTRWRPGQSGNPAGRKRGSRNKLADDFVLALHDDFLQRGPSVIARCAEEKPEAYLKIIASLLPKDVNLRVSSLDDLTDEQLLNKLSSLTEMARPLLARITDGNAATSGPQQDPMPVVDAEYTDVSKG